MKISGPKGPGSLPPSPDEAAKKPAPSGATPAFRDLLRTPATKPPQAPLEAAFTDIQARLRTGELDATRASELLVETVVQAQLPQAAPRLQAQLREALQRLLREDPVLAAKLRQLSEAEH